MSKWQLLLLLVCVGWGAFFAGMASSPQTVFGEAAETKPEPLTLTEIEQLRVEGRIKDLQLWQMQFQLLLAKIKADHKWGEDVIWDQNQVRFVRLPQTPGAK